MQDAGVAWLVDRIADVAAQPVGRSAAITTGAGSNRAR
jgi:hypothetical protein